MDAEKKGRDVTIQITKKFKDIDVNIPKLKRLVKAICTRFTRYEISIALIDDAEIRRVNSLVVGGSGVINDQKG